MAITSNDKEVVISVDDKTSVSILKYGATIISWKADGKERLWLSEISPLDGSAAVRGGIPLVFPVFGTSEAPHATSSLPPHGYARIQNWELVESKTESTTVQLKLEAGQVSKESRALWDYSCTVVLTVTLTKDTLKTEFAVENTDTKPFEFNCAFHTYFQIPDISQVQVTGLKGLQYFDKMKKITCTEESVGLSIEGETAKIYQNSTDPVSIISQGTPLFTIEAKSGFPDVVVWNPWREAAQSIPDFAPKEGFQKMICVEAGTVSKFSTLQPKEKWAGSQTIKVHF